jgi:hypothetical protein
MFGPLLRKKRRLSLQRIIPGGSSGNMKDKLQEILDIIDEHGEWCSDATYEDMADRAELVLEDIYRIVSVLLRQCE